MAGHLSFSLRVRFSVCLAVALAALSASAVDYWWTGNGNDGLWTSVSNWATDAQGTPATAAPVRSDKANYYFDVSTGDLVVTVDSSNGILASNLVVTAAAANPAELKIVSSASGVDFDFTKGGTVTVGTGATLVLNVDMGTRTSADELIKYGTGTLAFDLVFREPKYRSFTIREGQVVVRSTSLDPHFTLKLNGSDPSNPPVFENQRESGLVFRNLSSPGYGGIKMNGSSIHVGDESSTSLTNTIPTVLDAGTFSYGNERVSTIAESSPGYNLELDRADVVLLDNGPLVCWSFDDANDPKKDVRGQGGRFLVNGSGTPTVIADAERGNVLSLNGTYGFKGPDASTWVSGFEPKNGFTFAFWMKPDSSAVGRAKILWWGASGNGSCTALRLHDGSEGGLFFNITGSGSAPCYFPVSDLRNGAWHHIAVAFDAAQSKFFYYYDGACVKEATFTYAYTPTKQQLYIGNTDGSSWANNPYKGLMDDFLLVPRTLSLEEIVGLKEQGAALLASSANFKDVVAKSSGALAIEKPDASVKTLSGNALAGGVEMKKAGAVLTVGAEAGEASTDFKGTIAGTDSTLVKTGEDYEMTLDGAVKGVTNVVVDAGTLTLRRPLARRGLVCWYSFDDAMELGRDNSSGGMNLVKGDVGTPTSTDGVCGKAVHFSAEASEVSYLHPGASPRPSNFPKGNDSFTISAWVRPETATCTGTKPICGWGRNVAGRLVLFRFNGQKSLTLTFNTYALNANCSPTLDDGQWHHVVATYDGTNRVMALYCDGVGIGTNTLSADIDIDSGTYGLEIAHINNTSGNYNKRYGGDIDEFMVFDYAWSADEVSAEYSRAPALPVAVETVLPAPVARWTFDGENPLADTTGNPALTLSPDSTNDTYAAAVSFESGDAICGTAVRFNPTTDKTTGPVRSGFLKLATFPADIIPSGNTAFSAIVRYRPDTNQGSDTPCITGWGDNTGMNSGKLFRFGVNPGYDSSVRFIVRGGGVTFTDTYRTSLGNERTRWYTVAMVYQPSVTKTTGDVTTGYPRYYVDGEYVKASTGCSFALPAQDFAIGSSFIGNKVFCGLVDDVQIYNCALTDGQVRMITEQLEASKGLASTTAAVPAGVLKDTPDVTVVSGAVLNIASTENIGNLSGAGTVTIAAGARLNVTGTRGFTGTVTGAGVVGIADNAVLDFGDGSTPLIDIDRPLALGTNVTIRTAAASDRFRLASATSFLGAENLATWTVAGIGDHPYNFIVTQDGNLDLSLISSTIIIFR